MIQLKYHTADCIIITAFRNLSISYPLPKDPHGPANGLSRTAQGTPAFGSKTALLLDVREIEELTGTLGSIDEIVHIPLGSLAGRVHELKRAQNPEIVIICRSGARAVSAARIVADAGFRKVGVLEGGMVAWNAS